MLFFKSYPFQEQLQLADKPLLVYTSRRAEKALSRLNGPIRMELRLYFSCVLKKTVFIDTEIPTDDYTPAHNDQIFIKFSRVTPPICDPEEFARDYPVERHLDGDKALKIHPRVLYIDYCKGDWQARYEF